jgi:hypothetical protein
MLRSVTTLAFGAALFGGAPAWADITATQTENIWQVEAEGEPLSDVLMALQAEAGFRLIGADRLIDDGPITTQLTGPLDDVIARLLQGFDYALVYGETPETEGQVQRLVLLSGRAGATPDDSQRAVATRLPDESEMTPEDGARVSALLERQVQPLINAELGTSEPSVDSQTVASAGDTGSSDSSGSSNDELDAETQAQLAEATRRAQQDLEALVRALREQENNANSGE